MFRLLRYFSIASLVSMVSAAVVLGALHQYYERDRLMEFGERQNVALTRAFTNIIWPSFRGLSGLAGKIDSARLGRHPDILRLDSSVREAMRNTRTIKVKIIQPDGHILFSTDFDEIGADYSAEAGFLSARQGWILSEVSHFDTFKSFDGVISNRDTLSSYVAIRSSESAPIEGVLEIYTDVTDLLANDAREERFLVMSVIAVLVALYGALFFIVRHADIVIRRQDAQQRQAEQRLLHAITYDALTDLPNRVLLLDRVKQSIAAAERHSNLLAVAHVNLDEFKNITNAMGHHVGDKVLQVMAKRLTSCLREGDTIARIGGDEFVVSLPDIRSSVNLFQIAKKMLGAIALPVEVEGRELHLTASIGIALYPEHGKDVETLMRNAGLAMHSAKQLGRNRHQMYVEHMSEQVQQQAQIEDEMWRALGNNEFRLYYQPVIDLKTGAIVGAEALLRWPNAHDTWLSPEEFIPLSEKCGLIAPLSEWVLTEACTQLQAWRGSGQGMSNFTMAVNLSQRHFASAGLATIVADVVEQTEIDPRWLHLDISEGLLTGMNESILTNFDGIKRIGVKFSLDNFGTGFSSLGYLRNYPIDLLKIDRAFIKNLPGDADHAAIVTTIIALANSLGLTVVAKGVETDEQVAFLREHGCHQAQGFLFSRPLPPDEFLSLVQERRDMRITQSLIPFKAPQ
ncbi:MAG: bifunctional diguanylate cyclase/phosphodiesterase [Nitrosomonadales bacterium]|nr:bifunctional diguanylate cyclase/phosphodiesterase [Nitrosomonadales bacterium]